jgi:microcystin-dependent protein
MNPGMIMMHGAASAPTGWVLCDGATYTTTDPVYQALFGVIGYSFGGSGGTFKVPDLKGRVPIGVGAAATVTRVLGTMYGNDTQTLVENNLPSHKHTLTVGETGAGQHNHNVNAGNHDHNHAISAGTGGGGDHGHNVTVNTYICRDNAGGGGGAFALTFPSGNCADYAGYGSTTSSGAHNHPVNANAGNASVATHNHSLGNVGNHTHSVTVNMANTGNGVAFDIIQPSTCVNFIIKL